MLAGLSGLMLGHLGSVAGRYSGWKSDRKEREAIKKAKAIILQTSAERNNSIAHAMRVQQGYGAKADMIRKGKGKNGKSMTPELLARHGVTPSEVQRKAS
jgi:hypothetical protein